MLSAERESQWSLILVLSGEMLDAARAAQWSRLVELETRRRDILQNFFAQGVQVQETEKLQQGIQRVMAMDKEIYTLSQMEKHKVEEKLAGLNKNKSASQAYFRCSQS